MSGTTIHFYFDFLSPYAYLASRRLPSLARSVGYTLEYHPVDLAWLKLEARNTGPATREMPLKLAYARTDMQRWAALYGVPLIPLKNYDSSRMNKGVFFAADRGADAEYVNHAWTKVYGEGQDMADDAVLSAIATAMGWDPQAFLAYVASGEADERLRNSNREAHAKGAFGVPMMIVDDNLWWGNDRLELMQQYLVSKQARAETAG
jgi:2-hydroxychromene-2-carboxylate isomerase